MSGESVDWSALRHAFAETADPDCYVPRSAIEALIASLDHWRSQDRRGSTLAALVTQPGLGKTFFLRLVEQRINREAAEAGKPTRALYLPYANLSLVDLSAWVHGLLGLEPPYPDARDHAVPALASLFALAGGPSDPFFLLIDDADSMPPETIRLLQQGLPRESSPLRILAALGDDAKSSRLLAALDALEPSVAILRASLTEEETAVYLRTRLRRAGVSAEVLGGLDADQISRIRAQSGGVPREIHRVMTALIDARAQGLPPDLDAKQKREGWMGEPIKDDF
jgi:type II secretory pathway predicted ATPase ExeA